MDKIEELTAKLKEKDAELGKLQKEVSITRRVLYEAVKEKILKKFKLGDYITCTSKLGKCIFKLRKINEINGHAYADGDFYRGEGVVKDIKDCEIQVCTAFDVLETGELSSSDEIRLLKNKK